MPTYSTQSALVHYCLCPAQSAQPELRLQGHTRPSGEVADSADARGNKASGCKVQLELNLMSWNKIHQSLQPETAFSLLRFLFAFHKFFVLAAAWKPEGWQPSHQTDRWNIFITGPKILWPTVYHDLALSSDKSACIGSSLKMRERSIHSSCVLHSWFSCCALQYCSDWHICQYIRDD